MTSLARTVESRTGQNALLVLDRARRVWARDKWLYVIMLPPALYFFIFHYIPMYGVILAFKDFSPAKGILGSPWVGLKNFEQFFTNPYSFTILKNTIIFRGLHLTLGFPMPIILALLLNELTSERFKRLVQTSSYLPHFISLVVVAGMVSSFLSTNGMINQIVAALGGQARPWLMDPNWFRPIWLVTGMWQHAGWTAVIYLASLTGINPELYEAAAIDGAGRFQRLRYVTVPGLMPTIIIMFLLRVGQFLNLDFQLILLLYTPSTYEVADVLGTFIYRRGILSADFSYATAVGLFQSFVGLFFIVGANKIAKKLGGVGLW